MSVVAIDDTTTEGILDEILRSKHGRNNKGQLSVHVI